MRKLPYQVTVFDSEDNTQSKHCYPTLQAARAKYKHYVTSAACANTGRVILFRIDFGRHGPSWTTIAEWVQSPPALDYHVAGYIVHSVRSVNGNAESSCKSVNKMFYKTEAAAVRKARELADKWSDGHEGLIVFKAVKHVSKVNYSYIGTRTVVKDIG